MAHEFAITLGVAAVVKTRKLERDAGEGAGDFEVGGSEQRTAVIQSDYGIRGFHFTGG
jgi:hypothetical protein